MTAVFCSVIIINSDGQISSSVVGIEGESLEGNSINQHNTLILNFRFITIKYEMLSFLVKLKVSRHEMNELIN